MSNAMFELELIRPGYLWCLIVIPVIIYYFANSLVDFPAWQKRTTLITRIGILVLLTLSISGLTLLSPSQKQFVVFVVDKSLSVDTVDQKETEEFIREAVRRFPQRQARVLTFSDKVSPVRRDVSESSGKSVSKDGQSRVEPDPKPRNDASVDRTDSEEQNMGTNIAAAIEVARASVPPFYVPKIVLFSDGNETTGDALQAALGAKIPIDTVLGRTRSDPEVQVSSIDVPAQVRQGEPFLVKVAIDSNIDGNANLRVYRGPHLVETSMQSIRKGKNNFQFRQSVDRERLAEYTVQVGGIEDTLLDNNQATGLVFSSGKPRILLVDSDTRSTRDLVFSLEEQGIKCDVRPPAGTPSNLADLQNYEAIILSNVPATDFSLQQMEVLRTYVQDLGGGLIMLGGDQSFGLGGYYKTTLEEILPVRSDFEKEKEKPSLAMVLAVDKSGSMGGVKMELAKDAAKAAVELLGNKDQVAVIAFDAQSYWVSQLHSASDKSYVIDRISTIEASGGTSIYPSMEMAFESLNAAVAKLKHVILLTDGQSQPGDFEGIASQMASSRITLSTIAIGEASDRDMLEMMARVGNGRYYFCNDPQSVPQIFAKETVTASKSAINEQPFVPKMIRPTPVLGNLDIDSAPFLLGYVVTRPKPTSEFILATESGDPLLVWWRYGLGVTVAFTSDAQNRWAAEWVAWPEFGTFWSQVVRHAMRKSDAKGTFVEVKREGDKTKVVLDSVNDMGQFRNQADSNMTVIDPVLGKSNYALSQVAPGRYEAEFPTEKRGTYHLELAQNAPGGNTFRQSRGITIGYPEELRLQPPNEKLMREIAAVTGGEFWSMPAPASSRSSEAAAPPDSMRNEILENVFDIGERQVMQAEPLWPYLLMLALVLFLFDVALRRIDFGTIRFIRRSPPN